jgi:hypothetical protein
MYRNLKLVHLVMLIRNLNSSLRLCTETRLIITGLSDSYIDAKNFEWN